MQTGAPHSSSVTPTFAVRRRLQILTEPGPPQGMALLLCLYFSLSPLWDSKKGTPTDIQGWLAGPNLVGSVQLFKTFKIGENSSFLVFEWIILASTKIVLEFAVLLFQRRPQILEWYMDFWFLTLEKVRSGATVAKSSGGSEPKLGLKPRILVQRFHLWLPCFPHLWGALTY